METIGLRELNQNPSRAVARVRAGVPLTVTDRGKPVLRMIPEVAVGSVLEQMVADGQAKPPADFGMPELLDDLLAGVGSVSDVLIADRDKERRR